MNKNVIKKNSNIYSYVIFIIIFLSIINLSGCVNNQKTEIIELSKFIGSWAGNLEIPIFGVENNSTITKLIFAGNSVTTYLTNQHGTLTMNYSYKIEGNNLILETKFTDKVAPPNRQPFNNSLPFNDTRLPFNESWPPNSTMLPNYTIIPDGPAPNDGKKFPNNSRYNISISFIYSFNEELNILYLDESEFIKIQ